MSDNLIERCHWGFLIGGGRENVLRDNILVDCDLAFQCDARGLGWAANSRPTMMERLLAVPYQSPKWKSSYPGLPSILEENPMAPSANVLEGNSLVRAGTVMKQMEDPFKKTAKILGNHETQSLSPEDARRADQIRKQAGLINTPLRKTLGKS
jgi:hypothetical protein